MIKKRNLLLHISFRAWKVSLGIKIMPVKAFLQTTLFLLIWLKLPAQNNLSKPILDTGALKHWKSLFTPAISNNGFYVGYIVDEGYTHNLLYLKSLKGQWKRTIQDVRSYQFSNDNRIAVVLTKKGQLNIINLGNDKKETIDSIILYKLFTLKNDWLLFQNTAKYICLRNIKSNEQYFFKDVSSFYQSGDLEKLLFVSDKNGYQELYCFNLRQYSRMIIGQCQTIDNIVFSEDDKYIAFSGFNSADPSSKKQLWLYSFGNEKPRLLADAIKRLANNNLSIESLEKLGHNGEQLFIQVTEILQEQKTPTSNVEIWKHSDPRLISQTKKQKYKHSYLYSINTETGDCIAIEKEHEQASFLNDGISFIVLNSREGDMFEDQWNSKSIAVNYIFNSQTNTKDPTTIDPIMLSPDGRYVIGFNESGKGLGLYETATGITSDITSSIEKKFLDCDSIAAEDREKCSFAGWYDDHVLVYDNYDIWEIDPANPLHAINLTNGYGREKNVTFRFAHKPNASGYRIADIGLLNVFDNNTKKNGFYLLDVHKGSPPEKLVMENWFFNTRGKILPADNGPLKARDKNIWLLKIEKRDKSANYFITENFKDFRAISNEHPEEKYLWYKTELINFRTLDGKITQSIIYKPENFDSTKRYPVLINYYETLTNNLNRFRRPDLTSDAINIPWFVSKGYIVCTPDIIYTAGKTGMSCVNTLEALANKLSELQYVDSTRIGIQGHSFGGFETIFTVTHSNKFAVAMASSGYSDLVNDVLSVKQGTGINFSAWRAEKGQGRFEYPLWSRPDIYLDNSPVLYANRVTTPLLMMNNDRDGIVNFSQGLEFFIALRQLKKQVWLLNYKGEDHSLNGWENKLDYTQKLEDYFGYYLKSEPMPEWMKP